MYPQRKMGPGILHQKITFQGRTESLDWKKIASIDIDNLIQEGDTSQLSELISPVTFCKAESEFHHGRIDPGFIKVFRLSQIISEVLLASHESCAEKLSGLQEKYDEAEKEKGKLSEELQHLRETLTSAKKELKKRKEMLASSQNEILGPNNSDEYDQCPYCTKRFLTSGYLLAHIQRRHQGLPVNPLYPSLPPGGTSTAAAAAMLCHHHHLIQNQTLSNPSAPLALQTHSQAGTGTSYELPATPSQSHHGHPLINHPQQQSLSPFPVIQTPSPGMLYGISQIVNPGQQNTPSFSGSVTSLNQIPSGQNNYNESYNNGSGLLQKKNSCTQTAAPPEKVDDEAITNSSPPSDDEARERRARRNPDPEKAVLDVIRLQDQFEERWQNLGEKVRQSGIEVEMKGAMISQQGQAQDFSNNSPRRNDSKEEGEVTKSPAGDTIRSHEIIEELKRTLHASVQDELKGLVVRLESQEQFWQNKLASVQQDHEQQIQQIRLELRSGGDGAKDNGNPVQSINYSLPPHPPFVNDEEKEEENDDDDDEDVLEDTRPPVQYESGEEEAEEPIVYPSSQIMVVGPRGSQKANRMQQHPSSGVLKDTSLSAEIPVAKPRNMPMSGKDDRKTSSASATPSPNQPDSASATPAAGKLQSLSESEEAEYLTVIQPEEIPDKEMHDNQIMEGEQRRSGDGRPRQKREQQQQQWQSSTASVSPMKSNSAGVGGMSKSGDPGQKSDGDVSDYTLSESFEVAGVDHCEDEGDGKHHQFIDHHHQPLGKSSSAPPVKKKYMFDNDCRKLVEVSPDDDDNEEEDDDEEVSSNSSQVNNSGDNDGLKRGRPRKKSQMDLVRAKTVMELEKGMADIGLNPESTAIGLEEMGRALKHLKSQRRASGDPSHNQEQFELERDAVKSFAKFAATKSSIDEKLEAISTLNPNKPQQSSFVRMFSAVKVSGKNLKKRVASAVKKRHKESGDEDNDGASGDAGADKKRKRKAASAPALKTTFFSKARWTRKKKGADGTPTKSGKGNSGGMQNGGAGAENENGNETASCTDEESEEEIVLPPFMTRSKPVLPIRRDSSRSSERRGRERRGNSSRRDRTRSRSFSKPKSSKPLKRLNSTNSPNASPMMHASGKGTGKTGRNGNDNYRNVGNNGSVTTGPDHHHRTGTRWRNSSDTSPFSNVDVNEDGESVYGTGDREEVGNVGNSRQTRGNKNDHHQRENQESSYEEETESESERVDEVATGRITAAKTARDVGGGARTNLEKRRGGEAKTQANEENWDDDDDDVSYESPPRGKAPASANFPRRREVESITGQNDHPRGGNYNSQSQRAGSASASSNLRQNNSPGKSERVRHQQQPQPRRWNEEESDIRLQEIKQIVDQNKRRVGVGRDENTSTEDDDDDDDQQGYFDSEEEEQYGATGYNNNKSGRQREQNVEQDDDNVVSSRFTSATRQHQQQQQYGRETLGKMAPTGNSTQSPYQVNNNADSSQHDTFTYPNARSQGQSRTVPAAPGFSGQADTLNVKKSPPRQSAVAAEKDGNDGEGDDDSDLEGDINDLLNVTMSEDELRRATGHKPQMSSSSGFGNGARRRGVGTMIQPTPHGFQRSNALMGRGKANPTRLDFNSRDIVSPTNSWDSWNSQKK